MSGGGAGEESPSEWGWSWGGEPKVSRGGAGEVSLKVGTAVASSYGIWCSLHGKGCGVGGALQ